MRILTKSVFPVVGEVFVNANDGATYRAVLSGVYCHECAFYEREPACHEAPTCNLSLVFQRVELIRPTETDSHPTLDGKGEYGGGQ